MGSGRSASCQFISNCAGTVFINRKRPSIIEGISEEKMILLNMEVQEMPVPIQSGERELPKILVNC